MIDLNKSRDFFNPDEHKISITIIGCGALGSHLAECLARLGIQRFRLIDDDVVATHNIANQMFFAKDIGRPKVEAVKELIESINPAAQVTAECRRVEEGELFSGYIALCVDSIEPRKYIVASNEFNKRLKGIFDIRMGLLSGQFYCADTPQRIRIMPRTMDFTDEEVDKATPKSACNFELSVSFTIKAIIGFCVNEMVKSWLGQPTKLTTMVDLEHGTVFNG